MILEIEGGIMKKILIVFFFAHLQAHAASFAGNGTDLLSSDATNPWFLESGREISWCVRSNDKQSVNIIGVSLQNTFKIWSEYILKKKVKDIFKIEIPSIVLSEHPECAEDTDLNIFVGGNSDVANSYMPFYPNAESFSRRNSFKEKWGRGFIWLSENSTKNYSLLQSQMLHQVGHVFGNGHVHGTIMEEQYANLEAPKLSIDQGRELLRCFECGISIVGTSEGQPAELETRANGNLRGLSLKIGNRVKNFFLGKLITQNNDGSDIVFGKMLPAQNQVFSLSSDEGVFVLEIGMEKYMSLISLDNSNYKIIFESAE